MRSTTTRGLLEDLRLLGVHRRGVHVEPAGRGVLLDALGAAVGAEHPRVVVARPLPVETVGLEGVVEGLTLEF
ncbi:hypothetical protein [Mycobacterium sp. AT1]|uniref:hypothetical protein n=1 Tax=Mycobacterium sp. AT1 TaxID=1961706 RepID=UPI001E52639F|nr:hypothetical protein [Mycobacterium sp. AT1]